MKEVKPSHGWYIVVASWIMCFQIEAAAFSLFFKPMLDDFGWDRATLSSVESISLVAITIVYPFSGRLTDRIGPRSMLLVTIAAQVISRATNGFAAGLLYLYPARFLRYPSLVSPINILINKWFTGKRGTALGIVATGLPMGTMILAPVTQHLILTWGWRPTMFFWAGVALVTLFAVLAVGFL